MCGIDDVAAAVARMGSVEVVVGEDGKQVGDDTAHVQEAYSAVVETGW